MNLRSTIDALCEKRLGRKPDLENPKGYNDLIQWLKIHDQRREHISACDKWAARVVVPEDNRIPARLGLSPDLMPCIVKCTHDSGGTRIVQGEAELRRAYEHLLPRLERAYGIEKGEWAYQFVKPRIMTEELLEPNITDYKFHCGMGKIRWVQVIADRASGPKETILAPDGKPLGMHMDHKMRHRPDAKVYPGDAAWRALSDLAQRLARQWRYVRVDLYWSRGTAWFGELTFWPLAGCYLTKDESAFGEMLELDLTEKLEPIVV